VLREKAKSSGRDPELLGEPHPSLCGGKVSLAASTGSGLFGSIGDVSRFPIDLAVSLMFAAGGPLGRQLHSLTRPGKPYTVAVHIQCDHGN